MLGALKKEAEKFRPAFLEIAILLEPALQQSLDALLRFRPRQRGQKRVEAVKEPIGTWQGDLINEVLRGRDRTPIEGRDPARERVDEAVQLGVGKCSVDIPISFRGIAVEVVRAEHDFKRPTAADQRGRRSVPPPPGFTPTPTSGWPSRVFSRDAKRMSQARTNSLLAPLTQPRIFAMLTTADLVRRTNVSIRIGRPEGPTAVVMLPVFPSIKVGKVEVRTRALEHDDTKAGARVHASELVLKVFEYGGVCNVERGIIEYNPPIGGRFLDHARGRC